MSPFLIVLKRAESLDLDVFKQRKNYDCLIIGQSGTGMSFRKAGKAVYYDIADWQDINCFDLGILANDDRKFDVIFKEREVVKEESNLTLITLGEQDNVEYEVKVFANDDFLSFNNGMAINTENVLKIRHHKVAISI